MKSSLFYNLSTGFSLLAILCALCGCISVPKMPALPQSQPSKPSLIARVFEPANAQSQEAAIERNAPLIIDDSPVRATVKREVTWFWVAGILCLLAAGGCAYVQLYIPAIKLGAAGILIPIFATWFAYHYAAIICTALIASAIGFLWAYRNSAIEQGAIADVESEVSALKKTV
jgi:hypothetical protein